ncbi:hypothetical protein FRC07_006007, partial [Ceratobasidium sp. 392]
MSMAAPGEITALESPIRGGTFGRLFSVGEELNVSEIPEVHPHGGRRVDSSVAAIPSRDSLETDDSSVSYRLVAKNPE